MSDKNIEPNEKAKKVPNVDQNQNHFGNWEDLKIPADEFHHEKQPLGANSSTSDCMFDWSPHTDFNDFMQKINFWVWECQQWKLFHAQYPALMSQSTDTGPHLAQWFSLNGNLNNGQTRAQANSGAPNATRQGLFIVI